jgi:hypothetical protein
MVYQSNSLWIIRDSIGLLIQIILSWSSTVIEKELMKVLAISNFTSILFAPIIFKFYLIPQREDTRIKDNSIAVIDR